MKRESDMSDQAVANRLEVLRQLYKLGMSLRGVRLDAVKPVEPQRR